MVSIVTFRVSVDYSRTVEDMVNAGRYVWSGADIRSKESSLHFIPDREDRTEVIIECIHFGRVIFTDEALEELERMGYRPINFYELLALGEQFPDLQREFPIAELGFVAWIIPDAKEKSVVAYLDESSSRRFLGLRFFVNGWFEKFRFGAVRK